MVRTLVLGLLIGFSLTVGPVAAQDARERLRSSYLLTGSRLRNSFREVVREPQRWTVEVRGADEKRQALGVLVSHTGEILTKASELQEPLQCKLWDGRTAPARVVGIDATYDVALLRIDETETPAAVWDDQHRLQEGQFLVVPGIADAPIAVGVLGAGTRSIPQSVRGVLGIRMDPNGPPRIVEVFSEGGAHAAGITSGDVILEINGEGMPESRVVVETVRKFRPGEKLEMKLQRGEEVLNIVATLTHPFGDLLSRIAMQNQLGGALSNRRDDFPLVFQHDAVLKPQDCGGCVVNLDGKAVGLNIARAGRTETYAIPTESVLEILNKLRGGVLETSTAVE
jgi:serine protease Do